MSDKVTEFTIDRRTWLRGEGAMASKLLREDGKMCCLGSFSLACGKSLVDIKGLLQADQFKEITLSDPNFGWLLRGNDLADDPQFRPSDRATEVMTMNDSEKTDDLYREVYLTKLFAQQGITVKFIN